MMVAQLYTFHSADEKPGPVWQMKATPQMTATKRLHIFSHAPPPSCSITPYFLGHRLLTMARVLGSSSSSIALPTLACDYRNQARRTSMQSQPNCGDGRMRYRATGKLGRYLQPPARAMQTMQASELPIWHPDPTNAFDRRHYSSTHCVPRLLSNELQALPPPCLACS